MVGRPHSQENGWGGVVVDVPITSPPMERLSCAPSCRGEKERLVSRVGVEGGVAEDMGGRGRAFLWAAGGAADRTPPILSLAFPHPFPRLPSHPRHHKGPGSFLWQQPKPLGRLASPPTSSWGTRDHRGR